VSELTIKEVTRENWPQALALRVNPEQDEFVPSVAESVAEAYIRPFPKEEVAPFALYAGTEMIGFWAYSYEPESEDNYWINGFLIDRRFQGKGYGQSALRAILAHAQSYFPRCKRIGLTVLPDNMVAQTLYKKLDFEDSGEVHDGELVYYRQLP
jgi:diamine N-acetyltransferase